MTHIDGLDCNCEECKPIQARMEKMMDAAEIVDGEAIMIVNETGVRLIIPQKTDPGDMTNLELNDYQKMAISFAEMAQDSFFRRMICDAYDAKREAIIERRGKAN